MTRESEIHKINTDEETIHNLGEITLKNIRLFKGFTFTRNPNDRLPSKFLLRRHLWLKKINYTEKKLGWFGEAKEPAEFWMSWLLNKKCWLLRDKD